MRHKKNSYMNIIKTQTYTVLIIAIIAGIVIIGFAFAIENAYPVFSRFILTLGVSMLGTSIGILFNSFTNASAIQNMRDLVEHSLNMPFAIPDHDLQPMRKVWHHYFMTQSEDKAIWRYYKLDLAKFHIPNKLVCSFTCKDPEDNNTEYTYNMEGYVVGPRLILVLRATQGNEPPSIYVYPFACEEYAKSYAGVVILKSWDKNDIISKTIMSANPLELGEQYNEGTISDKLSTKLDAAWHKEMAKDKINVKLLTQQND